MIGLRESEDPPHETSATIAAIKATGQTSAKKVPTAS